MSDQTQARHLAALPAVPSAGDELEATAPTGLSPGQTAAFDRALRRHVSAEVARQQPTAVAPVAVHAPAPVASVVNVDVHPVVLRRVELVEVDRRDQAAAVAPFVIVALMVAVVLVAAVGAWAVGVA